MTQSPEKPKANADKASPAAASKDTSAAKLEANAGKASPEAASKDTSTVKPEANAGKASPEAPNKDTSATKPEANAGKVHQEAPSKDASAAKQSEKNKPQPDQPASTSSGKGLAILALLCGLGGLGAGGWSVWHIQNTENPALQQQQQNLTNLQAQVADLAKSEQQLRSTIGQLPAATQLQQGRDLLASVQAEQQLLSQRLETVLGASRQDWRLAEAEHLLRMASLRLSALHDTTSARFLLEAADHILLAQNDPAAFAAREQLARSIAALKSSGSLDRTGLFVQLGALYQQANQLSQLAPEFARGQGLASGDGTGRWAQWWEQISRYLRVDFNASENVQPLLVGQSLTHVRLALGLALEQAQWAALNGAPEVYQQALQQALSILDVHFSPKDPGFSGLRDQISALHEQKVTQQLPNLNAALSTLQAYIDTRSAPQESNTEESN